MRKAKAKCLPRIKDDEREIRFAVAQVTKQKHGCDRDYRMPPSLKQEIAFMKKILADNDVRLSTPFAHIVDQDPDFFAGADSCKCCGGGWSTDLNFWWYLPYDPDVIEIAY